MGRRVGVVGIGAMGRGYARNLLAAGFDVVGYDRDPQRTQAFASAGGRAAGSAAEAAEGATWVVTALPKHDDVREATLGDGGIAEGADPGLLLVDTSTSLPAQSKGLAAEAAARGIRFVDASVSGTGTTVLTKDVVVLAGGAADDFAACRELFEAICRRAYHLGPSGAGAMAKLMVNVAVVGNRLALAEALTFASAAGMDPEAALAVLKDGSSYSRAMDLKGEKMIRRDYEPESTLDASLHGSTLLLEQGREVGAPMFLTSLYAQVAQLGVALGHGAKDPASLIEALLHMTGADT